MSNPYIDTATRDIINTMLAILHKSSSPDKQAQYQKVFEQFNPGQTLESASFDALVVGGAPGQGQNARSAHAAQLIAQEMGLNYVQNPPLDATVGPNDFVFMLENDLDREWVDTSLGSMDFEVSPEQAQRKVSASMEFLKNAGGGFLLLESAPPSVTVTPSNGVVLGFNKHPTTQYEHTCKQIDVRTTAEEFGKRMQEHYYKPALDLLGINKFLKENPNLFEIVKPVDFEQFIQKSALSVRLAESRNAGGGLVWDKEKILKEVVRHANGILNAPLNQTMTQFLRDTIRLPDPAPSTPNAPSSAP